MWCTSAHAHHSPKIIDTTSQGEIEVQLSAQSIDIKNITYYHTYVIIILYYALFLYYMLLYFICITEFCIYRICRFWYAYWGLLEDLVASYSATLAVPISSTIDFSITERFFVTPTSFSLYDTLPTIHTMQELDNGIHYMLWQMCYTAHMIS